MNLFRKMILVRRRSSSSRIQHTPIKNSYGYTTFESKIMAFGMFCGGFGGATYVMSRPDVRKENIRDKFILTTLGAYLGGLSGLVLTNRHSVKLICGLALGSFVITSPVVAYDYLNNDETQEVAK